MTSPMQENFNIGNEYRYEDPLYSRIRGFSIDNHLFDEHPSHFSGQQFESIFDVDSDENAKDMCTDISSNASLIWKVDQCENILFDMYHESINDVANDSNLNISPCNEEKYKDIEREELEPDTFSNHSVLNNTENKEEESFMYSDFVPMYNRDDNPSISICTVGNKTDMKLEQSEENDSKIEIDHNPIVVHPKRVGHLKMTRSRLERQNSTQSSDSVRKVGAYTMEERAVRIARFHSKRSSRIWRKKIKYDCRKKLADSRPRLKGRFVTAKEKNNAEQLERQKKSINPNKGLSKGTSRHSKNLSAEETVSNSSDAYEYDISNISGPNESTYLGRGGRLAARKAAMMLNSM